MEFPTQKFREIVFQLLYSMNGSGSAEAELIPFLMRELAVSKKNITAAYEKARKIWDHQRELDQTIAQRSHNYSLDRIKSVEKNVLRLAFFELLFEKELDLKIIISEAHRITRKFSSLEGASFVNAVLDETHHNASALSASEGEDPQ